ncbi:MAG: GNAT family N-acetyltransferase [Bradyrhizobium sp.]|nr:MAG: GNAT family N-acetyltransferase [Bradyrhizobium sp.]
MSAGAERSAILIEAVDRPALASVEAAWRDLSARCGEANAFAEPDFLLPALERLASPRVVTLLVWRDDTRAALIGLAAIVTPRLPLGLARIWRSEQAALPAILLDREAAEQALGAMLDWLAARRPRLLGLRLPCLTAQGPIAAAATALAARRALPLHSAHRRHRAALTIDRASRFEARLDKRRRKEWGRQRRRLEDHGRLQVEVGAAAAIEPFLALERQGWKGARGSALDAESGRAAFAREMLTRFAARGALRVHSLVMGEAPIAAGVLLRVGDRGFFWKTAYDERFAAFSPGVQATLELSRQVEREGELALLDSCAIEGHPMIDRVWPDRIELIDLALPLAGGAGAAFALGAAAERAREALKRRLKRLIAAARASRAA